MRKLVLSLSVIGLCFFSFVATAYAATAIAPEDGSLLDLAKPVYDAVHNGQYWLGASLALVFAVTAFRKYAPGKAGAWAHSEYGTPLLVLLGSFGGAFGTGLVASGTNTWSTALAWTAFKVALGAAGGYELAKRLLKPIIAKIAAKAPAWTQPLFMALLWVFESKPAIAKAEAAGEAAVKANPAKGTDAETTEI